MCTAPARLHFSAPRDLSAEDHGKVAILHARSGLTSSKILCSPIVVGERFVIGSFEHYGLTMTDRGLLHVCELYGRPLSAPHTGVSLRRDSAARIGMT